ncbi:MAG TPA: V-type ATPase subunit [Acholeplasma sp.]|nr:V-type ATPase subunit [Acholeplasma sp.]
MDLNFLNGIYYVKTENMLNEDDFNALKRLDEKLFIRYLRTKSYGFNSGYLNIESIIEQEFLNVKEELDKITKSNFITDIFYLEEDLTNMKIVYKEVFYKVKSNTFSKMGRFSKEALEQFFKYGNMKLLPKEYEEMFKEINKIKEEDLQDYLQELERVVFNFYTNFSKSNKKYQVFFNYLEYKKVMDNLKTFLKFKNRNESIEKLKKALLDEEIVGRAVWIDLYNEYNNTILNKLATYFNEGIVAASDEFLNKGNNTDLRKETLNYKTELLKLTSYNNETYAPILYYLHLKQLESYKVRELYYAK